MFRFGLILAGLMAAVVVTSTGMEARADHRSSGNSRGFGGYGMSGGYSRSHDHGYGRSSDSYGHGGYSQGWSGSGYRSSHYDYQPTQIQIHRGHIDVNPGHYDRYSSPHRGW